MLRLFTSRVVTTGHSVKNKTKKQVTWNKTTTTTKQMIVLRLSADFWKR